MANPVYGKQYIRFAETFRVPEGSAVRQFRIVRRDGTAPATQPTFVIEGNTAAMMGVSQYDVNDNVPPTGFATDRVRLLTVATSGLLLVESDGTPTVGDIGGALEALADGRASTAGGAAAVIINGTTPIIRDVLEIGGQNYVLASFS